MKNVNEMIYNDTLNDYGKTWNSCTVYVALLAIFVMVSINISSVYIYFHWYLKRRYTNTTNIKEINIKNWTYYFFDDMINIEDFDSNLLKIDKKSYKNIDINYIGYIRMEDSDYVKINNVNPLHLIIGKVDG